jgi:hypothetical protein
MNEGNNCKLYLTPNPSPKREGQQLNALYCRLYNYWILAI